MATNTSITNFNNILSAFKINANCIDHQAVGNYYYYDLRLQPNAKVRDIQKYSDEFSLALKMSNKPNIRVIHDQGVVRLEFATSRTERLNLFQYFTEEDIPDGDLVCLLGQTTTGQKLWMDLAQNPHMIVAGTTGSGKSVLLHNVIANILNYNDAKIILIDPKNIEFSEYDKRNIPNVQVGYTYNEAMMYLESLIGTMESRYKLLRGGYKASDLPSVVFIIDEFADLIMQDKDSQFYLNLCRLAQKSRAAKINIILATQRPSVNIVNGAIKANFPARIACRVASHIDSKVILDSSGAENLLGKGDAMVKDNFHNLERFQIAYTTSSEVCEFFGT